MTYSTELHVTQYSIRNYNAKQINVVVF